MNGDRIFPHATLPDVLCVRLGASGAVALIDAEDLPLVARYAWKLYRHPDGLQYATTTHRYAGRRITLQMHRVIAMAGAHTVVDHRSRDGLDNRKTNLRPCTHAQNLWNAKLSKANTSGVKGLREVPGGWRTTIAVQGVRHGRTFHDRAEAEQWLVANRNDLHGEFARHA